MRKTTNLASIVALSISSAPALAAVQYTFTDLSNLGDSESYASQINNAGQIVGTTILATGPQRAFAFLYENGVMRNLGVLGTPPGADYAFSRAGGINENGVVVGWSTSAEGRSIFTFAGDGPMQPVETGETWTGIPSGINNSGQIVASANWPLAPYWGFVTSGGSTLDLRTVLGGGLSTARAINDSGQVVGEGARGAYVYDTRTGAVQYLTGFESPAEARAINEQGEVVGFYNSGYRPYNHDGWVWRDGQLYPLGQIEAESINNYGQIVGTTGWPYTERAAIHDGSNVIDLNTLVDLPSGWVLNRAMDVNDLGQIVGHGRHDGQVHAFLLNPIPEPSAMLLLALAVAALLARRR